MESKIIFGIGILVALCIGVLLGVQFSPDLEHYELYSEHKECASQLDIVQAELDRYESFQVNYCNREGYKNIQYGKYFWCNE